MFKAKFTLVCASIAWLCLSVPANADDDLNAGHAAYEAKDYRTALTQFARACDVGSVEACGLLGEMYASGQGVSANGKIAASMLAKACDGGVATACGTLSGLYGRGIGVSANQQLASRLAAKACSGGDQRACKGSVQAANGGGGSAPPSDAVAYFDQLIAQDAAGWMFNRYNAGSMRNMKIESVSNGGRTKVVYGEYTYNQGAQGWVKARFTDETLECLEYWDFAGQCRPLGRSPSQGLVLGLGAALVAGSASGQGNSSDCNAACRDEREFYQLQKQQRQIVTGQVE